MAVLERPEWREGMREEEGERVRVASHLVEFLPQVEHRGQAVGPDLSVELGPGRNRPAQNPQL